MDPKVTLVDYQTCDCYRLHKFLDRGLNNNVACHHQQGLIAYPGIDVKVIFLRQLAWLQLQPDDQLAHKLAPHHQLRGCHLARRLF